MWSSLAFLVGGLAGCGSSDEVVSSNPPPVIPTAAPAPPPEPPPGPLPTIGPADRLAVEFTSADVDGGPIALACAANGATTPCTGTDPVDLWAVDVTAMPDAAAGGSVVITARKAQGTPEQGPQCAWLRLHKADGSVPTASAPRAVKAVAELPAALAADPPKRAWSLDLDGDGADEILFEQADRGATNTIGVVKADGQKVVVWQDEAPGPAGGPAEEGGEPVGSTGGTWSTLVGVTDTTLDGTLELVVDLDRHETFGWTVFSYAPTGAAQLAAASCKIQAGSAP